jgi:hypothetical protein
VINLLDFDSFVVCVCGWRTRLKDTSAYLICTYAKDVIVALRILSTFSSKVCVTHHIQDIAAEKASFYYERFSPQDPSNADQ